MTKLTITGVTQKGNPEGRYDIQIHFH